MQRPTFNRCAGASDTKGVSDRGVSMHGLMETTPRAVVMAGKGGK